MIGVFRNTTTKEDNLIKAEVWLEAVNDFKRYPNEKIKTDTYTVLNQQDNGDVTFNYDDNLEDSFVIGFETITTEQAIEEGFLPKPEALNT